jgi:UTP:GlnB (protein PII) uridylyltransferase
MPACRCARGDPHRADGGHREETRPQPGAAMMSQVMPSSLDLATATVRAGAELPPEAVESFVTSMPRRYGVLFGPRVARCHAAIALCRRGKVAHAEVWRALPDGTTELCVVADDRPGLLVLVAGALASYRLDVMTAFIFSRATGAGHEAIDFFWVRRMDGAFPLEVCDTEALADRLRALIAGALSVEDLGLQLPVGRASHVDVHFAESNGDGSVALVVETEDAPALLFVIARTLFANGVEIVRSLVRTVGSRVHNRFDIQEIGGATLDEVRRAHVCDAVAAALGEG